jgi:hypothetical protein
MLAKSDIVKLKIMDENQSNIILPAIKRYNYNNKS